MSNDNARYMASPIDDLKFLNAGANSENDIDLSAKIEKCINYLQQLKSPNKIIIDKKAFKATIFLQQNSVNNDFLLKSLLSHDKVIDVLVNIFQYYITELKAYINHISSDQIESKGEMDPVHKLYKHQFDYMSKLINFVCNITNESKSLCYKFHDKKGTEALIRYISETALVKSCCKLKSMNVKNNQIEHIGVRFMIATIGTLHNLTSIVDFRKSDFESLNATQIFLDFADEMKSCDYARILAYLSLANIAKDDEIDTLPDIHFALDEILKLLKVASSSITTGKNLKRIIIDIDVEENNEIMQEVCIIDDKWNIVEILAALYRLALNDKLKYVIYETYNVKDDLQKIIFDGNTYEKEFAAKVLYQLCFDKNIAQDVLKDSELCNFLNELVSDGNNTPNLISYCNGILWSIKHKENEISSDEAADAPKTPEQVLLHSFARKQSANHIMISYNWMSKDICLSIKKKLEEKNFRVWMDVEQIHGSSIESMADAVENSSCILMCMTEKYKQSPNCRAEAEYTFQLRKPFIPLIMQPNYTPDGWLGFLLGTKIYIHFGNLPYEECIDRLFHELKFIETGNTTNTPGTGPTVTTTTTKPPATSSTITDVKTWSDKEVRDWLVKSKIHADIQKSLKSFNGELLKQLNSIRIQAPIYFYNSVSLNNKLDLYSVVTFANALEKLF